MSAAEDTGNSQVAAKEIKTTLIAETEVRRKYRQSLSYPSVIPQFHLTAVSSPPDVAMILRRNGESYNITSHVEVCI